MALSFRYKGVKRPDGSISKAPTVPLTIIGKENLDTVGLLDSGADISAMSREMAELLGLDINKETSFAFGIGGKVNSVQSNVNILIEQKHERYNISIPVKIILDNYSFPLLLGRAGFFDEFIITFDQSKEKIILKRIEKNKIY